MKKVTISALFGIAIITAGQKVGVGTNSPVAKLHVEVPSGIAYPVFQANQQGSAVPFFIIQPSGNVGIGVANPSEALDVSGNIQFSGALMPAGNAGAPGQVLVSQGPGTPPQWQTATFGDNWGSQVAQTQAPITGDGTAGNPIALQAGTAAGDILVWSGASWQITQPGTASGIAPICATPTANYIQKWTGSTLCNSIIYDNGTKVGIGTTSPVAALEVVDNNVPVAVFTTTNNANGSIIQLRHPDVRWEFHVDANDHPEIGFFDPVTSTYIWNVIDFDKTNGHVGIGTDASPSYRLIVNGRIKTTGINELSDRRLKTDVQQISNALEKVILLQGVSYKWAQKEVDTLIHLGLIAQEVKQVVPEVVNIDADGYYSVAYTELIPLLIEAIKELNKQIEDLKRENEELKQAVLQ